METELIHALEDDVQHAELPDAVEPPPVEPEPVTIPDVPVQAVANQLGDVAMDTVRLAELQIRLFEAECRQSVQQLIQPVALLGATGLIAMASLVVLFFAAGSGLQELTGWPLWVSQLAIGAIGLIVAAIVVRVAWGLLQTPRISFTKSKDELMRNVEFLTRMIKTK